MESQDLARFCDFAQNDAKMVEEARMSDVEDSSAIPGLHDLRAWRDDMDADAEDAPKPSKWGDWDDATVAGRPMGAAKLPDDQPTPPPGVPLGEHIKAFFHLNLDGAMVLARPEDRRGLMLETVAVLGISLGASAISAILSIINSLTMGPPLNQQQATINQAVAADRPWLDLLYQLYGIIIPLVPVLVALYLLANVRRPDGAPLRVMGVKWSNVPRDTALGVGLAAIIGIPGLGLYALALALGLNVHVQPTNLTLNHWWVVPVLLLLAAMNGILEETVMVGYLFTRWTQLAWAPWKVIVTSALIRGAYHLYQGFGGFVGNFLMGLLFGWLYMRTKRVLPLVIAHFILDAVSFLGYVLLKPVWPWL